MHAGNGVRSQRCNLAEAIEQKIVTDGSDDPGHAGHIELERANPVLVGETRQLAELALREDPRMQHGVDLPALVHGPSTARKMTANGYVATSLENPDRD